MILKGKTFIIKGIYPLFFNFEIWIHTDLPFYKNYKVFPFNLPLIIYSALSSQIHKYLLLIDDARLSAINLKL